MALSTSISPRSITIREKFWERHPGLLFAFALLMGQYPPFLALIPLFFACYLKNRKKLLLILTLATLGYLSEMLYTPATIPTAKTGSGYLHIDTIKKTRTSFSAGYLLCGTLKYFEGYYDIPIAVFYKKKELMPGANRDYIVHGTLSQTEDGYYQFKSQKGGWTEVPHTFSFAQKRSEWKEAMSAILKKHLSSDRAFSFLTALVTGESTNYVLPILIGRLGLGHLFAISGLHFTCLIGFLSLFLFPFFEKRLQSLILLFFAILYSFYLGSSPSLLRAFVSSIIFLVAIMSRNQATPLNTLGLVLFFLNLFYPHMKTSIGFVLSFLATFSLIVFYPVMEGLLTSFFPIRCHTCFLSLSNTSKFFYLLLHLFKKCFSVNLAISLGTLPLLLYYWHTFPLLSLFYNTFFPFLTLVALFATLIALACYLLIPPFAPYLFSAINYYTDSILALVYYYPRELAFSLPSLLPLSITILWIICWIYTGLLTQKEALD